METQTPKNPLDKAEALYPDWLVAHKRVVRSAGYDSRINLEFAPLDKEMDGILDEYNDFLKATIGGVALRSPDL